MPETPSNLTLEDFSAGYRGRPAIEPVSLQIQPAEWVRIDGPSGSGKTTLLRTIAWLMPPLSGRALLDGKLPTELGVPAYRRDVMLLAQTPSLPSESIEACLRRPFKYASNASQSFDVDEARSVLGRLHLSDVPLSAQANELSIGQQQRVCLARALLLKPRVLLADEPTSGLDPAAAEAAMDLVREHTRQRGMAMCLVAHDGDMADRLCERTVKITPARGGAS